MSTIFDGNHGNDDRLRQFDEEMLRAEYASLFWAVITERRKNGTLTLQSIADTLGIDKSGVSRWFSGDPPNWELSTIASIASALDLSLQPPLAIDRTTGAVFSPAGLQTSATLQETTHRVNGATESESNIIPARVTRHPEGTEPVTTRVSSG